MWHFGSQSALSCSTNSPRKQAMVALFGLACLTSAYASLTPVTVDFSKNMDVPLLKKYAIYNSGIIPQERYTPAVLKSMGMIKAASLRIDLSIGKFVTGFTDLMYGTLTDGKNNMALNFTLIDTLAEGLQSQQVMPYWGLSYNPHPFQPICDGGIGSPTCPGSISTCRGFEDESDVPGTNNYTCIPYGSSGLDDCWKCPPKIEDDDDFGYWGSIIQQFHQHFVNKAISPIYEEHWNEPDLTEYYNPTLAAFKGSNQDYINMYSSCAHKLLAVDPDLMFGGCSVANQITHNPAYPLQPSNEDTLMAAAEQGLPMDFFSYHSITTQPGIDQVKLMVDRAQISREVLSSSQLQNATGELNRFATTEVHCNEFYPNSTTETLTSSFSSSPYLATILLQTWTLLLEETDLSMVHWAQYMDIFNTSDQIGLVDWWGNPRPAWWAFHWYAELPPERVELEVNNPYVRGLASFSARQCAGGVLLWNVPTPSNGQPATETTLSVRLQNLPLSNFSIEAYVIDDRRRPMGGFVYAPSVVYYNQTTDSSGNYMFPPAQYSGVRLPVNGTIYLKLVPTNGCQNISNVGNPQPDAQILRLHHYYGQRPLKTSLYAHFHQRDWTAYLGMGGEPSGYAITGTTVKMNSAAASFNISMQLLDGQISEGGVLGIRMDLPNYTAAGSMFEQTSSFFFYQAGTSPCVLGAGTLSPQPPPGLDLSAGAPPMPSQGVSTLGSGSTVPAANYLFASQNTLSSAVNGRKLLARNPPMVCGSSQDDYVQIPDLWGSEQAVEAENFFPVNLDDFAIAPATFAPSGWDGRVLLLFVMKDGTPGSKVRTYVTGQ